MTRKKTRIVLSAVTLAWMAMIFILSHQTGMESSDMSAILAEPFAEVLAREGLSNAALEALNTQVNFLIRKCAHVAEYAVLGAMLCLTLRSYGAQRKRFAWALGVLYAVTDEIHQAFIPLRAAQFTDVLIDSLGVTIGVIIAARLIIDWRKRHVHHS